MKNRILILANDTPVTLFRFRKEIITRLLKDGYYVIISAPFGEGTKEFTSMGCHCVDIIVDRRGTNVFSDLRMLRSYIKLIKELKPDLVLTYTIKPNIYGGIACRILKTPYMSNITGLGTAVAGGGLMQQLTLFLYKIATKRINCLFFQNTENLCFFNKRNITEAKKVLIPGSGVNLTLFPLHKYPIANVIEFVFVGRIMKDKGIEEYLTASSLIVSQYSNVKFHVCGFCEEEYLHKLERLHSEGVINYHGNVSNLSDLLKTCHCLVNPSYHEGMSNVLLEAAASGRPVLASNIPGCIETFDDTVSGFAFEPRNTDSLVDAIEKFLRLDRGEKIIMGQAGRLKVEKYFNRDIVVDSYISEIDDIVNGG